LKTYGSHLSVRRSLDIRVASRYNETARGSGSVVERLLPKQDIAGSSPVSRFVSAKPRLEAGVCLMWRKAPPKVQIRMINENIEITTLGNGVRVVSETVTHVQSVSVGLWVGVGSRDEEKDVRGITHFIEHMLFKGTPTRDARQIADEIESRGGSLNAFTD